MLIMEDQAKNVSDELSKAIESLSNAVKLLPSSSDNTKVIEKLLEETIELQKKNDKKLLTITNVHRIPITYKDEYIIDSLDLYVTKDQIITLLIKTQNGDRIIQYDFKYLPFADISRNKLDIHDSYILFNGQFITHVVGASMRNFYKVDVSNGSSLKEILSDFSYVTIKHKLKKEVLYVKPYTVKFVSKDTKYFIDNYDATRNTFTKKFYTSNCEIKIGNITIQLHIDSDMTVNITNDDVFINDIKILSIPEYCFINQGKTKYVQIVTFRELKSLSDY